MWASPAINVQLHSKFLVLFVVWPVVIVVDNGEQQQQQNALTHVGRTLTRALGEHTISNEKWNKNSLVFVVVWQSELRVEHVRSMSFCGTHITHLWTFVVAIGHFKLVYDVSFARELNYLVIIYFVFEPTYSRTFSVTHTHFSLRTRLVSRHIHSLRCHHTFIYPPRNLIRRTSTTHSYGQFSTRLVPLVVDE